MFTILMVVFFGSMLIGIPVAFSMGIGSITAFLLEGKQFLPMFPQRLWGGLDSFPLMAVPLFILAGKLMEEGGTSKRLTDFANLLVGRFRGGLGKAAVLAAMIFAGISGSGSADTSAIGAIMIPSMERKGYKKEFIACLIASGGTIGPIIPPSLMMVVYCTATGLSVGAMFLAGIIPGILMGLCLMVIVHLYALKHPEVDEGTLGKKVTFKEFIATVGSAIYALLMPLIIIGGIVGGIFTATEAAAISILLALIGGLFVYKEMNIKDLPKIISDAATTTSTVMMVVGMAMVMSWILSVVQFPSMMTDFMMSITDNKHVMMALVVLLLIIIGTFMDTTAALVIFVPFLAPLAVNYGIQPIHFAIVCIIVLHVGTITPPVGVLLYLSCGMAGVKFGDALKYIFPFFASLIVAALIVAYVPAASMFIPQLSGLI